MFVNSLGGKGVRHVQELLLLSRYSLGRMDALCVAHFSGKVGHLFHRPDIIMNVIVLEPAGVVFID